MKHYQLIVIGGGPAGLAAAHAAWEAGLRSVLVIERDKSLGGILNQCIHNGFGLHRFKEELTGPEYAGRFIELLAATGVEARTDTMVLQLTPEREVFVSSAAGVEALSADTIVLAMGCRERARGAVGIPGARCAGVFTAGTAQMYMNLLGLSVGRRVVIRGTGDIGLIMARRLTLEGAKVLACIGAGDRPDGLARNVQQCLVDFDIPLLLRHTVTDVRGAHRVEQVVAAEVDAQRRVIPGTEKTFDCDTLLLSIGLIPENELARQAGIPLGRTGGAVVYENNETCVPGIFACGNALQVHDLVDFVTEESVRAGRAAAARVLEGPVPEGETLEICPGEGVNYTVPGYARKANLGRGIELSFRVKGHYGDTAAVTVYQGEKQIARFRRPFMTSSEMVKLLLPAKLVEALDPADGPITVCAGEEKEAEK